MSNLPEIIPVSSKYGVDYIVVVTPEFPDGAWWQLITTRGELVTYGFANRIEGSMRRAADAGKKAARYRIKKDAVQYQAQDCLKSL